MIIEKYLDEILEARLKQYGLRYHFIKQIKEDILDRICSLSVKSITQEAIGYFRQFSMEEIGEDCGNKNFTDVFGQGAE